MTLVCIPILVHDEEATLGDAWAAADGGADLVELRIDEYFTGGSGAEAQTDVLLRLIALSPLPVIVTCRLASEGGGYEGDEADRISLLERLANTRSRVVAERDGRAIIEHAPRYIDVEHEAYARSANIRQKVKLAIDHPEQIRDLKTSLILSAHDVRGRPADLHRRVLAMAGQGAAEVVKVAFRARSLRDSLEILDLPAMTGKPTIALGMGEFGLVSRVLAPKFGAFLTFASLRARSATAPGQPTLSELLGTYRFRAITRRTRVLGVVGYPLGHSLSPLVHNAGFEAVGEDAVYLPLPVAGGDDPQASYASFKATMLELIGHRRLDFRGCSVTLPHKGNAFRLAREQGWSCDAAAQACGAANTLVVEPDGGVRALNTDAPAVLGQLAGVLGALAGRRVLVLGAGGMARAAAWAAASAGARVSVWARRPDEARRLSESLGAAGWARTVTDATGEPVDAVVNCTPVGMVGGPDPSASPLDVRALAACSPGAVVLDGVYRPLETPLLARAREAGLRTVDGVGLFVAQAALQFEAWTGRVAPLGLFERIVREGAAEARQ